MLAAWVTTLALSVSWVEITSGLPPHDDFSTASFGDSPDELWLGTMGGWVYRTTDDGESWELKFRPRANEPLIEPRLGNLRAAFVGDLNRGVDRDLAPQDRASQAKRAADAAGGVRDKPRDRGAPLLSALMRPSARDRVRVAYINHCEGTTYLVTPEALWRSFDRGIFWDRLFVGPAGPSSEVFWLTCDSEQPGRIALNTGAGPLESFDYGESFVAYSNPFPRSMLPQTASLSAGGRMVILSDRLVFRERANRRGWDRICTLVGDSVEADQFKWAWWASDNGNTYGVSDDGVIACIDGKIRRLPEMRVARRMARYVWIDWSREGHVLTATEHEVYESFDAGLTFKEVFVTRNQRTIRRIMMHPDREGDLLVMTGNQIYRRTHHRKRAGVVERGPTLATQTAINGTPLYEVVNAALDRNGLSMQAIGARRSDIRLRGLMPRVQLSVTRTDNRFSTRFFDALTHGAIPDGNRGSELAGHNIWTVFAAWDLHSLIHDLWLTDLSWVDVNRLRSKVAWRVQDYYAMWARESEALNSSRKLTTRQRVYHQLSRQEAAAYLNNITGGAFAAFHPATSSDVVIPRSVRQ